MQKTIFELDCMSKRVDPQPSYDAADDIRPAAEQHRQAIISVLPKDTHMSNAEIALGIPGLDRYQVARRMVELERRGLVERRIGLCSQLGKNLTKWRLLC